MLDYKDIIIKHYGLGLSGREIAKQLCVSKSGVNDFLTAFKKCGTLGFLSQRELPTMRLRTMSTGTRSLPAPGTRHMLLPTLRMSTSRCRPGRT